MAEMRLYNGRLLPKIPPKFWSGNYSLAGRWYEHIFLMRMPSEDGYDGWLYRAFYTHESEYTGAYLHSNGHYIYFSGEAHVYELSANGEWTKLGSLTSHFGWSSGKSFDIRYFFWANTGLHHRSINFYYFPRTGTSKELKEELPVAPAEHTPMLQGWLVGKRLAGMRGQKQEIDNTARLGLGVLGRMILGKE